MNKRRMVIILLYGLIVGVGLNGLAQAALIDRGGGFIYDDVLDITWTQNANIRGVADTWANQVAWADSLSLFDSVRNVTWNDWRLASLSVAGGVPTGSAWVPVDCSTATELACRDNELGYMFYQNLGGAPGDDLTQNQDLIQNIADGYWSGTDAPGTVEAWLLNFTAGAQLTDGKLSNIFAWAVRDGDVAVLPASFQGLGDLPGGLFESHANGISEDGSIIVGRGASASGIEAFRWTSGGGIQGLGDLPGGLFQSIAYSISEDGSIIVGQGVSASGNEAFRWTSGGGIQGLGDLPGGSFASVAYGVSGDGSIIVGQGASASGIEAFRWTSGGGIQGLGDLPGGLFQSIAYSISEDGSIIVGQGASASGNEAFRWTSGGGIQGLGDLPGGSFASVAYGVSGDGSIIVGQGASASGNEAFRWTSGGGIQGLGDLPGGSFASVAYGVSGDGSIIVGQGASASGFEASIWDSTNNMRSLKSVLTQDFGLGALLTGWRLEQATGISADGRTIVGDGQNPSGKREAWIAHLDPPNNAPTVYAGLPQTITLPNMAALDGSVNDDGFPRAPGMVTTTWTKVSGPGTVTFGNANAVDTTATFSLPGSYVLRLTANDSVLSTSDEVTITVNPIPPMNQPPTVNAGFAQTITLPNTATLNGTVTDDGLPDPPGIVATTWTKVSGSGTVTFGNAAAVDTTATFSQTDTYVLRLTATDGALTRSAEVTITVNPPWVETVPDIRGLWTEGPTSLARTGCQNPADNGFFFDPGGDTYSITDQTGANFSFTIVISESDGRDTIMQTETCSGTVAADGTVNASCTYVVTLNGRFWFSGIDTLTGTLAGNTWTYTVAGQDLVGDTCQYNYSTATDTRSGPVPPPVPVNRWSIAGIGDLDGNSTADLLWRDTRTGAVAAWFMNGLTVTSSAVLATIPADWIIAGIGDLDANGTADVLWRHPSSGTVAAWYMTPGTGAIAASAVLANGLPADWLITGMGDLDNNGTADVVWRHVPSGLVAAWYMTSGTGAIDRSAVLDTIPPDWVIGGVGDLDGNGTADVLWRHPSSGTVAAWYMTPGTGAVGPSKVLASGLPGDWLIGGMGDLDDNGTADVVWRHQPSGLVAAWLMTPGTGEVGTSDVISTIPPDWNIAGMGDLNLGNGPADVVWHHPSSGLAAGWLMNGLNVDDSGVIDAP